MTDQDTTLAVRLCRARESRGVTLDQAHQSTGISLRILRGLESGSTDVVEPIYMRLALVSYAEHLGLDGVELAGMFDAELTPLPPTPAASGAQRLMPAAEGSGTDLLDDVRSAVSSVDPGGLARMVSPPQLIGAGVAVLLVLVLVAAWLDFDLAPETGNRTKQAPPAPPPANRAAEKSAPAQFVEESPASVLTARGGVEETDATTAVVDSIIAPPMSTVIDEDDGAEVAERRAEGSTVGVWGPSSVAPRPSLVLEALAVDTTLILVLWDGKSGVERTMAAGERGRWTAQDSFFVRSGMAHGVQFTFQGRLLGDGRLGNGDEVLRFHADRDGVLLLGRNLKPSAEPIRLNASSDAAGDSVRAP